MSTRLPDEGADAAVGALVRAEDALRRLVLSAEPQLLTGVPEHRQRAMRRLVQNGLRSAVRRAIPHTSRLAGPSVVEALLSQWLDTEPPRTRWVRELPSTFASFVGSLALDQLPHAACPELVHWETLELEVLFAADAPSEGLVDRAAAGWFPHPSARLCAYRHDVFSVDDATTSWPKAQDAPLFAVCFRVGDRVRYRRISAGSARVLTAVETGASLVDAWAQVPPDHREVIEVELAALMTEGALTTSQGSGGER